MGFSRADVAWYDEECTFWHDRGDPVHQKSVPVRMFRRHELYFEEDSHVPQYKKGEALAVRCPYLEVYPENIDSCTFTICRNPVRSREFDGSWYSCHYDDAVRKDHRNET